MGICAELVGEKYDPEDPDPDNSFMREALYEGKHDLVQACFFIEHRARLAILKAAIDYTCQAGGSDPLKASFLTLPATFHQALAQLAQEPHFRRYALFWQVFLWGFGGFYLEDRQDTEFQWLSQCTGIPSGEIPRAVSAYDALFPTSGGSWMGTFGPSQCRITKMVPGAFLGIGAVHRRFRYDVESYRALGYADYTTRDLARWNNNLVDLLS